MQLFDINNDIIRVIYLIINTTMLSVFIFLTVFHLSINENKKLNFDFKGSFLMKKKHDCYLKVL